MRLEVNAQYDLDAWRMYYVVWMEPAPIPKVGPIYHVRPWTRMPIPEGHSPCVPWNEAEDYRVAR